MSDYIRQLTEKGLTDLGYLYNQLAQANTSDPEKLQHLVAIAALTLENVLKNELISLSSDERKQPSWDVEG
jgi:hypothetical protein